MILLDSDIVIEVLRERPAAIEWFNSIESSEGVALPGYVVLELASGCRDRNELRRLQRWAEDCRVLWLPISECQTALQHYFEVTLRNAIDVIDMLVARIALLHGVPLHTFNQKHYKVVRGLRTVQPFRR